MTQEHIPGPRFPIPDDYRVLRIGEIIEDGDFVVIKSKKAFDTDRPIHPVSVGNAVTAQDFDFHFFFRPLPPDPEHIPPKPGGEAAAPLDAQDGGLKTAMIHLFDLQGDLCQKHCGEGANRGYHLDGCRTLVNDLDLVDTRLSSLRESVASLTRERDEAKSNYEDALRVHIDLAKLRLVENKERDALRNALDHLYQLHCDGVFSIPDRHYLAITGAAAALSPISPKEAQ